MFSSENTPNGNENGTIGLALRSVARKNYKSICARSSPAACSASPPVLASAPAACSLENPIPISCTTLASSTPAPPPGAAAADAGGVGADAPALAGGAAAGGAAVPAAAVAAGAAEASAAEGFLFSRSSAFWSGRGPGGRVG